MQNNSNNEQFQSVERFLDDPEVTVSFPFFPEDGNMDNIPSPSFYFLHYHHMLEIGYCDKGSGIFNVENKVIPFQAECISIMLPEQFHSAQSNANNLSHWKFLYISLDKLFVFPRDSHRLDEIKAKWQNYSLPNIISKSEDPIMYALTKMIIEEARNRKKHFLDVIAPSLMTLLEIHFRHGKKNHEQEQNKLNAFHKIENAFNYININYSKEIAIKELSDMCFLSEASFRRYFHDFAKCSPYEYINSVRLNRAAVALLDPERKILDISQSVGFTTLSSFNRAFLKYFKKTPRDYRKEHSNSNNENE